MPSCDSGVVGRVGPISGAPLPRFESIRAPEANLRRGPSLAHGVDWEVRRRHMPICVISEIDGWRRIELPTGQRGWMSASLISETRYVVFLEDGGALRGAPSPDAEAAAQAPALAPLELIGCDAVWCEVAAGEARLFVQREAVWGVSPIE